MTKRWVTQALKAFEKANIYTGSNDLVMRVTVKLLARQHRAMETKIKSVRSAYVKAQAESKRVHERSTGKARREAQLDVTHLQVGIDVCDELLAALAKQGKGGK